jgi:hypothetical protein
MFAKLRIVLAALCFLLTGQLCCAQQALDNASVIKLTQSGLSEDLIVQTISASAGHYDTGADALIALKQAGATDKEIGAMLMKNANPNGPSSSQMPATIVIAAPPPPLPGVTDVGVYFKDKNGQWVDIESENVNFKTGGVLKSAFSDGVVKPDVNGHLTGPASKLKLNNPIEFAVYTFEGQDAGNYQLLHLHTHSDGREFRSVTGGVFHASGGAQRDTVEFQAKRIAPRTYIVTVSGPLPPGEYGFLPPGTMNTGKNMASLGEMYTFTVVE